MTELTVSISNVGGIDDMTCTIDDPMTIITGPNASNKSSLLKAIGFGLGRSTLPVKNDATEARVELVIDGERVVRTARATENGIQIHGDAWLETSDDIELLERFGCLLEFSEVRQAVHTDDVKDILKAPMNIDALERERAEKLEQKTAFQNDLSELTGVEAELADREAALEDARDRVGTLERELDELRELREETTTNGDGVTELRKERADLVGTRNDYEEAVTTLEDAIARLDDRITETEDELEAARSEAENYNSDQLHAEKEEIQRDLHDIEDRLDVLQSVLTANREMLGSSYDGVLGQDSTLLEDSITCWACGNETPEADFRTTIDRLQELVAEDKQRRQEHKPRLDTIERELEAQERSRRRVDELEAEKRDLEGQRSNRAESLATKREQLSSVRDDLAELDEELADREAEQQSEVTDLAADIEQLRVDLHAARREVERLESTVTDHKERVAERDRKTARIEKLTEEITDLTDHIENLETQLRNSFNDAMDQLIRVLGYEGIDRVWLDGSFDLIVAREVDGVTRQDSVDHLSESEREMVGLVLALSGYVAYDVADVVPVLMIDTLGAFDADRTADLLAYFADRAPVLIAALLPDSAAAIADADIDHTVIEPGQLVASV